MQTRPCPGCGKFMIRLATGQVLGYLPRYSMAWRCACGQVEDAGSEPDEADGARFRRLWRMVNKVDLTRKN